MQNIQVTKPFGVSVKSWRKLRGFSQEEFAHRAGLHRTYVCDIERGSRNISLESIQKLARALEISTERLFAYDPDSGVPKKQRACDEEMVDILIVEDNPEDVHLTMQLLGKMTNSICVVKDGQEALDFLFHEGGFSHSRIVPQPRLVLLDLVLPKISGFEVLRRLRADPRTRSVPVIILTASESDKNAQAWRGLGAQSYIVKPVNAQKLTHIASHLNFQWALFHTGPLLGESMERHPLKPREIPKLTAPVSTEWRFPQPILSRNSPS